MEKLMTSYYISGAFKICAHTKLSIAEKYIENQYIYYTSILWTTKTYQLLLMQLYYIKFYSGKN